jgi:hypothetical protein
MRDRKIEKSGKSETGGKDGKRKTDRKHGS